MNSNLQPNQCFSTKCSNLKFTSELFARPSSTSRVKDHTERDTQLQAEIESIDNSNLNSNFNLTSSSFFQNDSNKSSLTSSVNFTKHDLSVFDKEKSQGSDKQQQLKKRKPFEKLSFHSQTESKIPEDTQFTQSLDKNTVTGNIEGSTSLKVNNSNSNSNSNSNHPSQFDKLANKTDVSFQEKSFIMTNYKCLSKETFDKARLFNSQFSTSVPFWIKFFEEIETDSLKPNSSYFKVADKEKYVMNLIEMVQKDAELYDKINQHTKIKSEVQNEIKNLINEDSQTVEKSESNLEEMKTEKEGDNKINEKLAEVLCTYSKLNEKDRALSQRTDNFDQFRFKLLTEGKFTKEKEKPVSEENANENENKEIQQCEISPEREKQSEELKLINSMNFEGDDYTFRNLNYENIQFGCLSKNSIERLLEIDRKLNKLNPEKYTTSINTVLNDIQKQCRIGEEGRMKEIDKKYNDKCEKFKSKEKKKTTIFDIQPKDETKVKYKDYLQEFKNKKNLQNSLYGKLACIEQRISDIQISPVDEEKRNQIKKDLESYHEINQHNPDYIDKLKSINFREFNQSEAIQKQCKDLSEKQKDTQSRIIQLQEEIGKDNHQAQEINYKKIEEEIKEPYNELMNLIEQESIQNNLLKEKSDSIMSAVLQEEEKLKRLSKRNTKDI